VEAINKESIVQAIAVSRTFGKGNAAVHALRGANLNIAAGRLVALRGRSGSGKTTLINMLGALDHPTEGSIYFKGAEISGMSEKQRSELRRSEIGLVFQSFGLVPLMSAFENVELSLRISGIPYSQQQHLAEQALDFVGLKNRMMHRPYELSGGEQQRVAIARAFAHKPALLLADEPTAELDSRMGLQMMKVFKDLVKHEGITIIMTTHDPAIMEIVDQVYTLEDGTIVEER
jgi:putative ABC transport system ATP-binding protein